MTPILLAFSLLVDEAAGTDDDFWIAPPASSGVWRPEDVYFLPDTTDAADATNYGTVAMRDAGDASDIGSVSNASTAFTAGTPRSLSVDTDTDAEFDASAGEACKVTKTDAGTGANVSGQLYGVWRRVS